MNIPHRVRFGPEVFRFQRFGGVSRYVIELHKGLLRAGVDSEIFAGLHISSMLDGVDAVRGRQLNGPIPHRARQAFTLAIDRMVASRQRARLGRADVWHPSYFDEIPDGPSGLAVTMHDMVHERFPEEMGRRDRTVRFKRALCDAADVVLCVSATTAADVQECYGIDADRLVVTHLGVEPATPTMQPNPFDEHPFALFVGDRRPRYKNWTTLLDALVASPRDLHLLCVGSEPTPDDRAAVADRGLELRVRFEKADDGQLAGRYRQARVLVYPSRYEGFGLPPLEALAQGCPVVAGRAGSVPEVVGDIAHLVAPDVDGITEGLHLALADAVEISSQRARGPAYAARFTWDATARSTIEGYRRIS